MSNQFVEHDEHLVRLQELRVRHNGKYPAREWPGGYDIVYVFADGGSCCSGCANGENGSIAHTNPKDAPSDEQWRLIGYDVHEAPEESVQCSHCNKVIVSVD